MTAFNIGGFRAAVKSAAEATPPSLRYVSHPGAAAYRSVYNDSSKLIARNVARTSVIKTEAKTSRLLEGRGKLVAGAIAGAAIIGGMRNRSGRAADKMRGRPTGPYMY